MANPNFEFQAGETRADGTGEASSDSGESGEGTGTSSEGTGTSSESESESSDDETTTESTDDAESSDDSLDTSEEDTGDVCEFGVMELVDLKIVGPPGSPCEEDLFGLAVLVTDPADFNVNDGFVEGYGCLSGCDQCGSDLFQVGSSNLDSLVDVLDGLGAQLENDGQAICLQVSATQLRIGDGGTCVYDSMSISEVYADNQVVFIGNNDTALTPQAQGFFQQQAVGAPALHSETFADCGCDMFFDDPSAIGCCDSSPISPSAKMTQFAGELYPPGIHPMVLGGDEWLFEITRAALAPTCDMPNGDWDVAWALVRG